MNRQVLLLSMVAALLIVRFVFIPINDLRLDDLDEYENKRDRYLKGQRLIEQRDELVNNLSQADATLGKFESFYLKAESGAEAQLNVQQKLQSIAKENGITLNQVEWVSKTEGSPERAVLNLDFTGNLKKLMLFYTQCHSLGPWLSVSNIQFRVDKQKVRRKELGETKGTLEIEIYYVVKGVS